MHLLSSEFHIYFTTLLISEIEHKKIAGDYGAEDFFYASAFSNTCEKNLAGEYDLFFYSFIVINPSKIYYYKVIHKFNCIIIS